MTRETPRHALPSRRGRALLVVLPVVLLLLIVGVATVSHTLRGRTAAVADDPVPVIESGTATTPTPRRRPRERHERTPAPHRQRLVAGAVVKRIPPVPEGWVKVDVRSTLPTSFTVATYNVLGAGHTDAAGNRKGYADGATRIRWAGQQLLGHGVTVAGLQEFQLPQAVAFAGAMPSWQAYPGAAGGRQAVQNSIVWNTSVWSLVDASTTPVPYFGGARMPMPHVLLENRATGRRVWFANQHNPADAHGPAERWRDLATTIEIGLFNSLRSQHPLVVVGDMNEREEYLCRAGSAAGLHAANGGHVDGSGCHYPTPLPVDWILGSSDVAFSRYLKDESAWQQRTSDHPLYVSDATLPAEFPAEECRRRYDLPSHMRWCPPAG